MHRPSSSPAAQPSGRRQEGQSGLCQSQPGPYQQSQAVKSPAFASQPDLGVIGQSQQRASSGNLMSQVGRLQPLTPINPHMANRYNENRRSTPNPLPVFATSPAISDAGSPSHSRFPALERSVSQTSLSARRYLSRPRTPTPSSDGPKGKGQYVPRSSSLPGSPKSRRATPHPYGKPSVKHLTCFWWKVKGDCRFAEDDCLYSHRDTGLLADAPRQVTPGGKRVHICFCALLTTTLLL